MSADLSDIDREHLADLRRKGPIAIAPDGEGVPASVAIRLQLFGLAEISADHPQTVTLTRAGRGYRERISQWRA